MYAYIYVHIHYLESHLLARSSPGDDQVSKQVSKMGVMYVKTVTAINVSIAKKSKLKRREGACGLGRRERWQLLNLRTSGEAQQHKQTVASKPTRHKWY